MTMASSGAFEYLRAVAIRYGLSWRWWATGRRVARNGAASAQLGAAHDEICRREDAWAIIDWLVQGRPRESAGHAPVEAIELGAPGAPGAAIDDAEFQRGLRGLLRLLHVLGRRGVAPFASPPLPAPPRARKTQHDEATPDALRRLALAARRAGIRPGHEALWTYVDQVTPAQFNRLTGLAHHLRDRFADAHVRQWLSEAREQSPGTVATLEALMHTLDALEIF